MSPLLSSTFDVIAQTPDEYQSGANTFSLFVETIQAADADDAAKRFAHNMRTSIESVGIMPARPETFKLLFKSQHGEAVVFEFHTQPSLEIGGRPLRDFPLEVAPEGHNPANDTLPTVVREALERAQDDAALPGDPPTKEELLEAASEPGAPEGAINHEAIRDLFRRGKGES